MVTCKLRNHQCNTVSRYYAVELDQRQHAVSIMQQDTLLREGRQWGTARLAVEGDSGMSSIVGSAYGCT